jgi:hypothetical protein
LHIHSFKCIITHHRNRDWTKAAMVEVQAEFLGLITQVAGVIDEPRG